MKSYKITEHGHHLKRIDEPTPTPNGTQVLLKTIACGVCHSDIHLLKGYFHLGGDRQMSVPMIGRTPGHEVLGQVISIGSEVKDVAVGEKKVVYPWIGCGKCALCENGNEHLCPNSKAIGINQDGGFSDHLLVPHSRYLFAKGDIPDSLAATYGCSGLTAYSAIKKASPFLDQHILIVGAGGVGMMAVQIAQAVFDLQPIVIDLNDNKLEEARSHGATYVFNAKNKNAIKEILSITQGGAMQAIDFVGSEKSTEQALRCLNKGGKLVVVGLMGGELRFPIPLIPMLERKIEGCYVGSLDNMKELMTLVSAGKIPPIKINERPLSQCNDVLNELEEGNIIGRAVLTMD